MDEKDALNYLPQSAQGFDHNPKTVAMFRSLVIEKLDQYITDSANADSPISVVDFSVEMIYMLGRRDGLRTLK